MIAAHLRELVRSRAGDACEYCRLPQRALPFAPFHIDHVIPQQHHGATESDNLALACDRCNAYKGTNLAAIDPATRQQVALFNPRTHIWTEHFRMNGARIEGRTDVGRATADLLKMNADRHVALRHALIQTPSSDPAGARCPLTSIQSARGGAIRGR